MSTAMAQVNVRLSRELKQAGDDALSTAGLSPSEVIRAVYARASALGHSLHNISDIVVGYAQADESQDEKLRRMELFDRTAHTCETVAHAYGLQGGDLSQYAPMTDEEVEEAFYQDYLAGGQ